MIKKPILSDRDKKNVLSAKKKQKVVLKNLLVQPFDKYWPELTLADVEHFAQKFRGFYKSKSSDKSKETLNTVTPTSSSSNQIECANDVILGLRSSIRCVSSGRTVALFISSKIRPRYIVDQIIIMTVTQNAKSRIFCVPDIDVALLDVLGFSCQCLAVLEGKNEIWDWAVEKSTHFPLPKSFMRSEHSVTEQMDVEATHVTPIVVSENSNVDPSTLYLRRESDSQRAFIPHGTVFRNGKANDFISLGETSLKIDSIQPKHQMISKSQPTLTFVARSIPKQPFMPSEKFTMKKPAQHHYTHQSRSSSNYLPLKVNRVQSNPEKVRNKNKKKNKKNKK